MNEKDMKNFLEDVRRVAREESQKAMSPYIKTSPATVISVSSGNAIVRLPQSKQDGTEDISVPIVGFRTISVGDVVTIGYWFNLSTAVLLSGGTAGSGGGGGGTGNYEQLSNKPQINSVELIGNKSSTDFGLYGTNNTPPYPVTSVNNKTGNVGLSYGDVGAAPAGYGLGENPVYVADANLAQKNGWYAISGSTLNLPDLLDVFNYSFLCVDVGNRPDVFMLQTACTHYQYWMGCKVQRVRILGVWQPWEWVNPPMLAGVEYRTTERYMGKPVYAKLVFVGAGPTAGSAVTVNHGVANMGYLVDFCGVLAANGSQSLGLPYYINANNQGYLRVDHQNVVIYSVGTNLSGYVDTNVWLKYTKTTD